MRYEKTFSLMPVLITVLFQLPNSPTPQKSITTDLPNSFGPNFLVLALLPI